MAAKTYRNAIVAVSLFSLILLVSPTAHAATTADVPNANSIVKDNIEYYMQTDKVVYDVRKNVEMLYRVTNVGEENVEFVFTYGPLDNTCDWMVDKDGIRIWDNLGRPGTGVMTYLGLGPSQSYAYTHTWDMTDNDGESISPGNYTVTGVLGYYPPHERYVPVSVSIDIIHEPETYVYPGESIQARIDDPNVIDGDTIIVYPGTYTGDGNRDIDFLGKAITVRSIDPNDPNIVAATIIDCDGTEEEPHRGFYFHNDEDENSILAGLTITNGYAYTGGAICCQACRPTITNCIITLNTGGGIHCGSICYLEDPGGGPVEPPPLSPSTVGEETPEALSDSNLPGPTITNCTFTENTGSGVGIGSSNATLVNCIFSENSGSGVRIGGSNVTLLDCFFNENSHGVYIRGSNTTLVNCTFHDNFSWEKGGAIYSYDSNTTLTNCIFTDNSTNYWGGAIYSEYQSSLTLTDCTFIANSSGMGGGGIYNIDDSSATLVNCTFNDNSSDSGGGIYNKESSLKLTGCKFNNNLADFKGGGGIYSECGKPIITNCNFTGNFTGNSADGAGGGIFLYRCYVPPILPPYSSSPPFPSSSLDEQSSWETLSDSNTPGPLIANCIFTGNSAPWGGGLYTKEPNSIVTNCLFTENSASYGGGMSSSATNTSLVNCTFRDNSAQHSGGGLSSVNNMTLTNCIFTGNSAQEGGGMRVSVSNVILTNSTFGGNLAPAGKALACNSFVGPSSVFVANCILWDGDNEIMNYDNSTITITYSDVQGGWAGVGNIDADPFFVDITADDYRLLPTSLCIDAGDPDYIPEPNETDLDGNPRIIGGRIDMGAYEHPGPRQTQLLYVDDDAIGANNGSSWDDAFNYLQDALAIAGRGDEIRVAQGIYKPDQGTGITPGDREATFPLTQGLIIKGSYAGFGPPDPNEQNIELYVTILTGDLNGDDTGEPYEPNNAENSYHVITASRTDSTALLDGFIVIAGNANGDFGGGGPHNKGGAVFNDGGSPKISNCKFIRNRAYGGGAIYNFFGSPKFIDCIFKDNSSCAAYNLNCNLEFINCMFISNSGGGMFNENSNLTLTSCSFLGNNSSNGGGMFNDNSNVVLTDCSFFKNSAKNVYYGAGGGMYSRESNLILISCAFEQNWVCVYHMAGVAWTADGGGMYNASCDLTLLNCSFIGNAVGRCGGISDYESSAVLTDSTFNAMMLENHIAGIYNAISASTQTDWQWIEPTTRVSGGGIFIYNSVLSAWNCTFAGNLAWWGGGMANYGSSPTLTNCILWGDTSGEISGSAVVTYSDIQGGWPGQGNIDVEPCFIEPGYWDANGTPEDANDDYWIDGDHHLLTGSPCIDAGDPNHLYDPNETDLDGKPRVINGRIDMGAYEYSPPVPAEVDIDPNTLNLNSKGKWITAFIWLPEEYDVADIDPNSIFLEGDIEPDRFWFTEDNQIAIAKFDRQEVQSILDIGEVELTISVQLTDGTLFEASDVITVIDKTGGKSSK